MPDHKGQSKSIVTKLRFFWKMAHFPCAKHLRRRENYLEITRSQLRCAWVGEMGLDGARGAGKTEAWLQEH
jgi:hypothetical protein